MNGYNLPSVRPDTRLTNRIAKIEQQLARYQPSRSSGTLLRISSRGVTRNAVPSRTVVQTNALSAFY